MELLLDCWCPEMVKLPSSKWVFLIAEEIDERLRSMCGAVMSDEFDKQANSFGLRWGCQADQVSQSHLNLHFHTSNTLDCIYEITQKETCQSKKTKNNNKIFQQRHPKKKKQGSNKILPSPLKMTPFSLFVKRLSDTEGQRSFVRRPQGVLLQWSLRGNHQGEHRKLQRQQVHGPHFPWTNGLKYSQPEG